MRALLERVAGLTALRRRLVVLHVLVALQALRARHRELAMGIVAVVANTMLLHRVSFAARDVAVARRTAGAREAMRGVAVGAGAVLSAALAGCALLGLVTTATLVPPRTG